MFGYTPKSLTSEILGKSQPFGVPIFIYHWIGSGTGATLLADFQSHLDALKAFGYETITFSDLFEWAMGRKILSHRSCIITFDDGNASVYTAAYPEVQSRNMKMTVFVTTGWLDNVVEAQAGQEGTHFTWAQAREMYASGLVDIQNHTHLHQDLLPLTKEQQKTQIQTAITRITEEMGYRPNYLAYPYGNHNSNTLEACSELGIYLAVQVEDEDTGMYYPAHPTQGRYELYRIVFGFYIEERIFKGRTAGVNLGADNNFAMGSTAWTLSANAAFVNEGPSGEQVLKVTGIAGGATQSSSSKYRHHLEPAIYIININFKLTISGGSSPKGQFIMEEYDFAGSFLRNITIKEWTIATDWIFFQSRYRPSNDAWYVKPSFRSYDNNGSLWVRHYGLWLDI